MIALRRSLLVAISVLPAFAAGWSVQRGLTYAVHDGVVLKGDLYQPASPGPHPALVAVHGGGWFTGDRSFYAHWGPYLAKRGFVLFAVDYRLAEAGRKAYPEAPQDVRAAVRFLEGRGPALGADPARIGLMGDSAGAHLAALETLTDGGVKACVAFYGIYDLAAHEAYSRARKREPDIVRDFMGAAAEAEPSRYAEASPLTRAAGNASHPAFFLSWGLKDEVVDPLAQSVPFAKALEAAGRSVTRVPVAGAGHGWVTDSLAPSTHAGQIAPRLLAFLKEHL